MKSSSVHGCVRVYNIQILNLFDPVLLLINTKSVIENLLNGLLGELKKFKVRTILILKDKKIDLIIKQCVKRFIRVLN